jgi:MFS family permease
MAESWRSSHMPRYLRGFLISHGLNAVFFMLTFGSSVFVLFLADLGLSKDRIGLMLSFFPFCGMIAPLISGWVTRFGLRRTYLVFYGARKLVILLILLAPWVLQRAGPAALFRYVAGVNLIFALCRAIAETGYYPWSREFIPDAVRGRVGGMTNVVVSLTSSVAMVGASLVLAHGNGYGRYQLLIVVASMCGVISIAAMLPVPRESPAPVSSGHESRQAMLKVLRDRRFIGFLLGVATSILALAGYPFLPLYAREQLLIPEARVVLFDVAMTLGALLSSMYWGWAADRYGGKPLTLSTMVVLGLLPWLWLMLPSGGGAFVGGLVLAFVYGAMSIGLSIASFRWFLNGIVPMEGRTAYTSIWYAGAGLAGGLAPFLAGRLLRTFTDFHLQFLGAEVGVYTLLFLATSMLTALSILSYGRVPAESDARTVDYVRALVTRDLPGLFARIPTLLRGRRVVRVRK